jgi:hypothetical protein
MRLFSDNSGQQIGSRCKDFLTEHLAHDCCHRDRADGKARVIVALVVLFAILVPQGLVFAQDHLAVELTHPVYKIIQSAEIRGVLTRLTAVKPYTRAQVKEFLATIEAHMGVFSSEERDMIRAFHDEFFSGGAGEKPVWTSTDGKAAVGVRIEGTMKFDAAGITNLLTGAASPSFTDLWHLNSRVTPYLEGEIAPWLSIKGEAGFTIDKIQNSLYLPYNYTKEWDATHIDFSASRNSDGTKAYPSFSYYIEQDISGATDNGALRVRLSRFRRDWGIGSGSFSLSGTARPFVGAEVQFRPSPFFAVSSLLGSLTNWAQGENEKSIAKDLSGNYTALSYQKMFGLQRMELFPFDWLTVSASSTLIGARRFELGYMSPLLFSVMYQNQLADIDNLGVQVDASVIVPYVGKLYGSFYADEMEITHLDELFTKARNMFALQGGAMVPVPGLPFTTFTAQYTKIEPFVYSHYPTWYPDYRLRVDTSYTQDGENLGYHLPPNSDEFLFRLETMPAQGWRVSAEYSFVRHGDNSMANWLAGKPLIYGDVNKYMDYNQLYSYNKSFLHDGIYDYNHIVKLNVYWRPDGAPKFFGATIPFELGAGYGFAYTWYEDGTGSGAAVTAPQWTNVLELSFKLFL